MVGFTSTSLVTGGTTGLGYWTAYEIARQSPSTKVIISSRADRENAVNSLNELLSKQRVGNSNSNAAQVEFLPLDLSSNAKVQDFVKVFTSKNYPPLSSLVLNAGAQFHQGKDVSYSADGVELTFATNQLGHSLLFFLLKPHLINNARIVLTSSGTHDPKMMALGRLPWPPSKYDTAELLAHPTDKEGYEGNKGNQRYGTSKLTNVLFTYALERRLTTLRKNSKSTWTVVAMDPGLMPGTSLGRDTGPVLNWIFIHIAPYMKWLFRWVLNSDNVHSPHDSGKNLAAHALANTDKALGETGRYFEGDKAIPSSVESMDVEKQEDLWRWTVDFLAGSDRGLKEEFERF